MDKNAQKCNSMLEYAVTKNKKIQKLIDSIEELGCPLPRDFFACRPCEAEITGGFRVEGSPVNDKEYSPQIIVCDNHIMERESFESTITHELVHAYDVCRAKINFQDCSQHACTEIRASALSDECNVLHELYRGTYTKFAGGQKDCVQRRATKSLQMNPNCKAIAEQAVSDAFSKCYHDQMPFGSDRRDTTTTT